MTERRECIILNRHGEATRAKFHRWGDSYYTDESSERQPLTVAIVELPDGRVQMCSPEEIQFTGPATASEALEVWAKLGKD